jgi:hypothetical protein
VAPGWTPVALTRATGLPRSTIANLESGGGNPSLIVPVTIGTRMR